MMTFDGFVLNEKYKYDKKQLELMIGFLNQCRQTMSDARVFFMCASLVDEKNWARQWNDMLRLKSFSDVRVRWTKEYSSTKGFHLQFVVAFDARKHNPNTSDYFRKSVSRSVPALDKAQVFARTVTIDDGNNKRLHTHRLKTEFNDAVYRYCYNAKLDQKTGVTGKSFGGCKVDPSYLGLFRAYDDQEKLKPLETKVRF